MYNHELTLISYELAEDEIGNDIKVPVEKNILCKVKDISSTEFYNAQVTNLKPEIKFIIHTFEYEGEKEARFKGEKYQIIRAYHIESENNNRRSNRLAFDEMELTCEKVTGNG